MPSNLPPPRGRSGPGFGRGPRRSMAALPALSAVLVFLLGACGDDPFQIDWSPAPDTVLLYSLARPEGNLPSGFNFNARRLIRIEAPTATGNWDIALDTRDGDLVFLPPGALNVTSRARITELPGVDFDDLRRAPQDTTLYSATEPLAVNPGSVYVVRTTESIGSFGRRCVYFAKMQPLVLDAEGGTLRFMYDSNPVCNDPRLVPPD